MEILVLSSAEVAILFSTLSHLVRKLLRGAACTKSKDAHGEKTDRSLTNAQVLEKLRFAPLSLELRSRQIRYYQQLVKKPANQCQVFAALFGQYLFETEPAIAPDGTVCKSNPWLDQFIADMEDLLQLDSAAEFLYGFSPQQPLTLFKDFAAAFSKVDPTELRVRVLSDRIPPPGYVPPVLHHPPPVLAVVDPDLSTFLCVCILPNGTPCTFVGKGARRLSTHMQKVISKLSEQAGATVTKVCPWCSRIFSEISGARHHIRTTLERGHCGKPRDSSTVGKVNPPSSLVCPTCSTLSPVIIRTS